MYPHYQPMGYQSMSGTAMTSGGSLQIPGYAWQQGPANQPLCGIQHSLESVVAPFYVSLARGFINCVTCPDATGAACYHCDGSSGGMQPFPMPVSGSMYSCAPTSQTSAASGSVLMQPAASQTPVATEQQPGSQQSDRRRRKKLVPIPPQKKAPYFQGQS